MVRPHAFVCQTSYKVVMTSEISGQADAELEYFYPSILAGNAGRGAIEGARSELPVSECVIVVTLP